ncbi:DoxX protein, partial [Streptomyces sp. NPDC006539]
MDAGLLILRLVIGLLIAGHGLQKVSFCLGGHGIEGGAAEFRADGFRGGRLTAVRSEAHLDGLFTYCLSVLCDHDGAIEALG